MASAKMNTTSINTDFSVQSPGTVFQVHMEVFTGCNFLKCFRNYWAGLTSNFQLSTKLKKALFVQLSTSLPQA